MSQKRIAVIAGDGIGKEVMPEGLRVMEAAASKFNLDLKCLCGALCFWSAESLTNTSTCARLGSCPASLRLWFEKMARPGSLAKLTCTSCVKTPKANTPALAAACTPAPREKL